MRIQTIILCLCDMDCIRRIVVNLLSALVTVLFIVQIVEGETGLLFLTFSVKTVYRCQMGGVGHQSLFFQGEGKGGLVDEGRNIGRREKVLVVGNQLLQFGGKIFSGLVCLI